MSDAFALRWALTLFGAGTFGNFALCLAYEDRTLGLLAAACAAGAAVASARLRGVTTR